MGYPKVGPSVVSVAALVLVVLQGGPAARTSATLGPPEARAEQASSHAEPQAFRDAQRHFYNARYEETAALTLALRASAPQDLANEELRTSALLFQLKGLLEQPVDKHVNRKEADKKEALRTCVPCPGLISAFMDDIARGQALA